MYNSVPYSQSVSVSQKIALYNVVVEGGCCDIDEIPQIINVFKGEMSLVGPRPLLPEYLPLYNENQKRRHNVKPGITGWAQINGRDDISIEQKVHLEQEYMNKRSILFDIEIIIKTFTNVLFSKGVSH